MPVLGFMQGQDA